MKKIIFLFLMLPTLANAKMAIRSDLVSFTPPANTTGRWVEYIKNKDGTLSCPKGTHEFSNGCWAGPVPKE